jgi:hypothetical protein
MNANEYVSGLRRKPSPLSESQPDRIFQRCRGRDGQRPIAARRIVKSGRKMPEGIAEGLATHLARIAPVRLDASALSDTRPNQFTGTPGGRGLADRSGNAASNSSDGSVGGGIGGDGQEIAVYTAIPAVHPGHAERGDHHDHRQHEYGAPLPHQPDLPCGIRRMPFGKTNMGGRGSQVQRKLLMECISIAESWQSGVRTEEVFPEDKADG